MRIAFRPLIAWPGQPSKQRRASPFSSTYPATLSLLERELDFLGAREAILQIDVTEAEIRTDGYPRANARPAFPGVVLSFGSIHGPLQYTTDVFDHWQDNLRAIALGLESLRRVDRYGITKRGEQYTGWRALPVGTNGRGPFTLESAAAFISHHAGGPPAASTLITDRETLAIAYRKAARVLHPDAGGDTALFARLQEAKRLLEEIQR